MRSVGRKLAVLFLALACLLTGPVSPLTGINQPAKVQAKQQHTSKEPAEKIIGKTETATIYDIGGGKKRAEIYPEKVRYKEENGEYTDYDTTLKKVKKQKTKAGTDLTEYAYQTKQSGQPAYFPQKLSKKTPVITENGTYQVRIIPQTSEQKTETSTIKPKQENVTDLYEQTAQKVTSVQYEDVLDKTTLQYEAETNGLKESILLDDASAGSEYHFQLQLKNCVIVTQKALTRTKTNEEKMFTTQSGEALYLYDTKKDKLVGSIPAAYVCRTAPNANYTDQNTNILCVGKRDTTSDVCRSYIKFEGINTLLKNKTVTGVRLRLNTYGATTTGMPVYVRRVTSSWNPKSVTYNSQPSKAGGTMGSFTTTSSSQEVTLSLPASEINSAVANGSWHGIELTDSSGDTNTTSANRVWIYNTVYINGDKMPKLEVVYTDKTTLDLPELAYNVYGKSSGWSDYAFDGETAGELSAGNPLQGFSMDLNPGTFNIGSVKYRGYFENSGWTDWKEENRESRETSTNKPMKAIAINVYGNADGTGTSWSYDVYYRVYAQNRGWLGWAKNGEEAGDYTSSGAILGIQAIIVPRLCYQEWYLSGGSSHVSAGDVYPRVPLPVGTGYNLYGIGICFSDEALRNKHIIKMTLTKRSKKSVTISSGSWNSFINTGGDINDCITGLVMRFNDAVMLNRYDIEHMGAFVGEMEEPWRKNSYVTGTIHDDKILEMISVRIVPKNYDESTKACISEQFVASENGFPFINDQYNFGYPDGYRIPEIKYTNLFGEVDGHLKYLAGTEWNGSCYGMALSTQMFYQNLWDINGFKSNIDSKSNTLYRLSRLLLKRSKALRDVIEYAQLSYILEGHVYSIKSNTSEFGNLLAQFAQTNYVMNVWITARNSSTGVKGGHAVIPLEVIKVDSQNYKIRLYDVNAPGQTDYATYNTTTKAFSYGDYDSADFLNVRDIYNHSAQKFIQIPQWAQGIATSDNQEDSTNDTVTMMLENLDEYTIYDSQKKDITTRDDIKVIPSIENEHYTNIILPKGEYDIIIKGISSNSKISAITNDTSVSYKLSDEADIKIKYNNDNTINSSIQLLDNQTHDVTVQTYDKYKNASERKIFGKKIKVFSTVHEPIIEKID